MKEIYEGKKNSPEQKPAKGQDKLGPQVEEKRTKIQ